MPVIRISSSGICAGLLPAGAEACAVGTERRSFAPPKSLCKSSQLVLASQSTGTALGAVRFDHIALWLQSEIETSFRLSIAPPRAFVTCQPKLKTNLGMPNGIRRWNGSSPRKWRETVPKQARLSGKLPNANIKPRLLSSVPWLSKSDKTLREACMASGRGSQLDPRKLPASGATRKVALQSHRTATVHPTNLDGPVITLTTTSCPEQASVTLLRKRRGEGGHVSSSTRRFKTKAE